MNQNKGIGAYKDRPGYFMGGMIGGAILGALVNKIQGKDWKRGAIVGGFGGEFGSWAGSKLAPTSSKINWLQKLLYKGGGPAATPYSLHPALAKFGGLGLGATAGAAATQLMGDPEADRRKQFDEMLAMEEERRRRNMAMYGDWYEIPWNEKFNRGGAINARPGYQSGGSLEYTDPDIRGHGTGEYEYGPGSGMIKAIPLGPEPSFEEEFGGYDELASNPGAGAEAFQAYENYIMNNNLTKEQLPFETFIEMWREALAQGGGQQGPAMAAEGGYKTRPQYEGGGIGDMDLTQGGASFGAGTGTSDDIPAMLSDGEFVVTANAVKNLGDGDRMAGAKRMYAMMNQLDPQSQTPAEMSAVGYG